MNSCLTFGGEEFAIQKAYLKKIFLEEDDYWGFEIHADRFLVLMSFRRIRAIHPHELQGRSVDYPTPLVYERVYDAGIQDHYDIDSLSMEFGDWNPKEATLPVTMEGNLVEEDGDEEKFPFSIQATLAFQHYSFFRRSVRFIRSIQEEAVVHLPSLYMEEGQQLLLRL